MEPNGGAHCSHGLCHWQEESNENAVFCWETEKTLRKGVPYTAVAAW